MVSIFKPDDANGDFCFPPKKYNNALLLNKIGGFWMVVAGRENFEHLRPLDPEMTILSPNSTFLVGFFGYTNERLLTKARL